LIALYLYFVPFFNARKLFWPFFALIILTYLEPTSLPFLIIFAAIFYYLLLIKDLLLIDRKSAYELLVLTLSFFLIRAFYESLGRSFIGGWSIWYAFLTAVLFGLLVRSYIESFVTGGDHEPKKAWCRIVSWLSFLIIWQYLILGLLLPLDFIYQSVSIFLMSVLVIDLLPEHMLAASGVSRERILTSSVTIGLLLFIVLASAGWSL
jgi:hypothetical protein